MDQNTSQQELELRFNKEQEVLLDQYFLEQNAFLAIARLMELHIPKSKEGLFHLLFETKSRFAHHVMTPILNISCKGFSRFIATVSFTAKFNQIAKYLESRTNFSGYME
jgi:hypothetical protein